MPLEDFIIHIYVLIDDWLKKESVILRKSGFPPAFITFPDRLSIHKYNL